MRIIDVNSCIGCGKCVEDCVNGYIELVIDKNGNRIASFVERGRCLECGHCNAICPQGAISGGKVEIPDCSHDELLSLMTRKRTVRKYALGERIQQDILDDIILAGQSAPTNRNRKSARIILIHEKLPYVYNKALDYLVEIVKKDGTINPLYIPTMRMNEKRDEVLWNAEYLVVFVGLSQNIVDAAIAAERMQLEAEKHGIGSAYRGVMVIGINNVEELKVALGIRSNEEALISFCLGKTKKKYSRPAVKTNRKVEHM